MNSLVRRMQGKSDLEKIYGVLSTLYWAGEADGVQSVHFSSKEYIRGRMRDLVTLLDLKFNDEGNIDWLRIITNENLSIVVDNGDYSRGVTTPSVKLEVISRC